MIQSTRDKDRRNIILNFVRWMLWNGYRLRTERKHILGDQKVSVHLMIQIHKVTSNIRSVSGQSPDIYWHSELYSRRTWLIYHGPHSECILWWPSSIHQFCGDFSNKLSFSSHPTEKKSGRERSGDLGGQTVLEMILPANTSSKIAIDICAVWAVAPSLKVGFVNFIFFQLRNEGTHNSVTVPLGVESVRGKMCPNMPYVTFKPKHQSSYHTSCKFISLWKRLKRHHWKIRVTTWCVLVYVLLLVL